MIALAVFSFESMPFGFVVWGLYFGLIAAGLMSVYYKRYLGKFVRGLIKKEAFSPDTALSLKALGLDKMFLLKRAITHSNVFSSIVYEKNDEVVINDGRALPVYHSKIDFSSARFYIPYELRIRAGMKFEKKGSHIVLVIIAALMYFILALLITSYYDVIMEFIQNTVS